ncbi:MAG: hypothetical protein JRI68_27360 [Deltaproteobacteria bacterium]|nr:hypothetical protein [Deltaproteobacteria bacterium]
MPRRDRGRWRRLRRRAAGWGLCTLCLALPSAAAAQDDEPRPSEREGRQGGRPGRLRSIADRTAIPTIDRVVVRWHSRATGGVDKPQFITARELAFEARIEALSERNPPRTPYLDKHVRAALQRHLTETVLAHLPVDPAPTPKEVGNYAENARLIIEQQVGGRAKLNGAAAAEGIVSDELNALLRRRARASWYLDKMVAPMLQPSDLELRAAHKRGETPYTAQKYKDIEPQLRRWYISTRLAAALDRYYRTARSRVDVVVIGRPGAKARRGRR